MLCPDMQLINITSWLIQNIYVLSRRCSWFDGYVVINGRLGLIFCRNMWHLSKNLLLAPWLIAPFPLLMGRVLHCAGVIQWSCW